MAKLITSEKDEDRILVSLVDSCGDICLCYGSIEIARIDKYTGIVAFQYLTMEELDVLTEWGFSISKWNKMIKHIVD